MDGDPLVTGPNSHESILTLAAVSGRIDDLDDRHGNTARRVATASKDITSLGATIAVVAALFVIVSLALGYFVYNDGEQIGQLRNQQTASDVGRSQVEQTQRTAQCTVIDALRGDFLGTTPAYADLNARLTQARTALRCAP